MASYSLRQGQSVCLNKIQSKGRMATLILQGISRELSDPLGYMKQPLQNQPPHGLIVLSKHAPPLTFYILCVCKKQEKFKNIRRKIIHY